MKDFLNENKKLKVLVLFFIVGLVVYAPALKGTFIFDDNNILSDANRLGSISNYFKTVTASRRFFSNRDSYAFWVLFLTEYKVFGEHPLGYKLVNLFFHILASFVFFLFFKRLLTVKFANDKNKGKDWIFYFSFLGGLLFLVHPVDTEAVSYIAGMNNGIGGFFFILGTWLFVIFLENDKSVNKLFYLVASLISFLISFFFKEVYLVFPIFTVFLYLILKPFAKKRIAIVAGIIMLFTFFVVLATMYSNVSPFPRIRGLFLKYSTKSELKTVATNLNAVVYSFYLSIFPKNLNIDHDLPLINNLLDWRVIIAFFIIVLFFFIFFKFRNKLPLSLFAYLSYLLLIAPSNSFILRGLEINGYDILSERNLYASEFFFVIVLLEFLWLLSKRDLHRFKNFAVIVIVLFGIRTFARNFDFQNNKTIWQASLKYSSNRVRPNYNYAVVLKNEGDFKQAIRYARKAFKIRPSATTAGLLASLYRQSGQENTYITFLESVLEEKAFQSAILYHELGQFYYEKGEFEKAKHYFLLALKKKPAYLLPRISLVYLLLDQGDLNMADRNIKEIKKYIKKYKYSYLAGIYVDNVVIAKVSFAEGLYYFKINEIENGIKMCERAIKLAPQFTEPYLKLGEYYFVNGEDDRALLYFNKAKTTPGYLKYKDKVDDMVNSILGIRKLK